MKISIEKELFQWDKNRMINIELDRQEKVPTSLQFYNKKSPKAKETSFKEGKNQIPNGLLKENLPIVVLACLKENEETQVLYRKEFKVLFMYEFRFDFSVSRRLFDFI